MPTRLRRRNRHFLLLVLATSAGCASTQLGKPFSPLGVPTGALLCRSVPLPLTVPPGHVAFEFEDGTEMVNDRLMSLLYDSVGVPRLLVMLATEQSGYGRPIRHVVSVSFEPGKPGRGFTLITPPGSENSTDLPREALSSAMLEESRNLMVWLWNHRCNRGPTGETPSVST
jgi:hypothetical protein